MNLLDFSDTEVSAPVPGDRGSGGGMAPMKNESDPMDQPSADGDASVGQRRECKIETRVFAAKRGLCLIISRDGCGKRSITRKPIEIGG